MTSFFDGDGGVLPAPLALAHSNGASIITNVVTSFKINLDLVAEEFGLDVKDRPQSVLQTVSNYLVC